MITLLSGENGFAIKRRVDEMSGEFADKHGAAAITRADAANLKEEDLVALLANASLFSSRRMVILRDVDENRDIAEALPKYLEGIQRDLELILISPKPDKRLRWYKAASNIGRQEIMNELNLNQLANWAVERSKELGATLSSADARFLVERTGLNQWQVENELAKLATYDSNIRRDNIKTLVDKSPQDSVFDLLDTVIKGRSRRAQRIYEQLLLKEVDAYQFIGLMSWQLHNLLTIKANSELSVSRLSSQAGLAPFVVQKTRRLSEGLGLKQINDMIRLTLMTDTDLKRTGTDVNPRVQLLIDQIGSVV